LFNVPEAKVTEIYCLADDFLQKKCKSSKKIHVEGYEKEWSYP
jgi:hypothetical protein